MSEVKRYTASKNNISRHVKGRAIGTTDFVMVMASDYDAALAREDALQTSLDAVTFNLDKTDKAFLALQDSEAALREELEMASGDLEIFKSAVSAIGKASKKLVFFARTSGGTAGPDQGLMDACAGVESVITLGGIARAMSEFEQLTAERDDLASRFEQARDRKNSIVALQQRLADAEKRVSELKKLICAVINESTTGFADLKFDIANRVNDALKPVEGEGL